MTDDVRIDVWLDISDADLEQRCAELLAEADFQVQQPDGGDSTPSYDVVITNRSDDTTGAGDAAVLRVGGPPASIGAASLFDRDHLTLRLDQEFRPDELRLACRMLGEIVRLRRQLRAEVTARATLYEQALTDPLTGLPNRRAWRQALDQRVAEAQAQRSLCVVIVDLDHFKQINEVRGYAAGDKLLAAAGAAFRTCLRQTDFIARLGGDEFGLLLEGPDATTAAEVVERVRAALPRRMSDADSVRASAGYAVYDGHPPVSAEALVEAADQALRSAKAQGRNRTVGVSMFE